MNIVENQKNWLLARVHFELADKRRHGELPFALRVEVKGRVPVGGG